MVSRRHWILDPDVTFLNHGSFGACPRAVLRAQSDLRARLERQPVRFLGREHEGLLDAARRDLAAFLGADAEGLAFLPNATAGVNTVLRSLRLSPGDEVLVTDQAYNACRNALDAVAAAAGARVVAAALPFPLSSPGQVVEAILAAAGPRTRLALIDHVTSPTALLLPIAEIVAALAARGIETLVDGAHAPGMVPLDLDALGAAFYTGNCHKWLCAPKGAAFLWVRADRRAAVRPLVVSHGANSRRTDRPPFRLEADWTGTWDPTPALCVPHALRFVAGLVPGGWDEVMRRNRALALGARDVLCDALGIPAPCPDAMIGSMAAVPLPPGRGALEPPLYLDPLQVRLHDVHRIEVPIIPWPAWPARVLRVSAQLYNRAEEYEKLAGVVARELQRPPRM